MPQSAAPDVANYDRYYGFQHTPFSLTPNPRFVYPSASHERALRTILHALDRREGLLVVTGEIGTGKTTLCRRLLQLLPPRTFLSLVLNPFLEADDLLKEVLRDFGLISAADARSGALKHASCHELVRTLHEFLGSLADLRASAVIIVDEAQNLPLRTLEQIRLLSNFETDTAKLLQIMLVGQTNLEPILALDEMRQLNQRVSRRCHLEPLSAREVFGYIDWRLSVARSDTSSQLSARAGSESGRGAAEVSFRRGMAGRFTSRAVSVVTRLSGGIPRVINLLCDRALEIGHTRGADSIGRNLVLAAAKDLDMPVPMRVRLADFRLLAAATVCVVALSAAALFWSLGRPTAEPVVLADTGPPAPAPVVESPPVAQSPPVVESPAVPAPQVGTVVEAGPSFEILAASFATAARAEQVASELHTLGYPARAAEAGEWRVVIVGPYGSLGEAQAAQEVLTKLNFTGVKVLTRP